MASKIKVKRILELREKRVSQNAIASTLRVSKHSIQDVCRVAEELGVTYSDVTGNTEDELYQLFFPDKMGAQNIYKLPDYEYVHKELAKVGVTLKLLHEEYKTECKENGALAIGYSKFCKDYGKFIGTKDFANHITHKPGDRIEVDWSGPTMTYYDKKTGRPVTVYLFVADLVYSRLAYVEPMLDMRQMSWMSCNINMWEYFGGVSRILVCDNLKTGVISHPREGEVILNSEYEALLSHYGTAALPAAVKAPRQKNSTEGTVGDIATAIIARLRNERFTSFESLSNAVAIKLEEFNNASFQKRSGSRRSVFETEEKEFLKPLPASPYEIGVWVYGRKVQLNSHVSFEKNFYSCHYSHIGKTVDLKITPAMVYIYLNGERIKSHSRFEAGVTNKYRTDAADLPRNAGFTEWTEERIMAWADGIGMATGIAISRILSSRDYPEQSFNSALSVLNLSKTYSAARLEKACEIAIRTIRCPRYSHLKAILSSGQDTAYVTANQKNAVSTEGCLRGEDYYLSLDNRKEENA